MIWLFGIELWGEVIAEVGIIEVIVIEAITEVDPIAATVEAGTTLETVAEIDHHAGRVRGMLVIVARIMKEVTTVVLAAVLAMLPRGQRTKR